MRGNAIFRLTLVALLIWVVVAGGRGGVPAEAMADDPVSVFVLHSYSQEYAWTQGQHRGLVDTLHDAVGRGFDVKVEYLDTKRVPYTAEYGAFFARYLAEKYNTFHPQAIYVSDDDALTFARTHLVKIFPNVPIFFSGINNFAVKAEINPDLITGVFERKEVVPNIDLIRSMTQDGGPVEVTVVGDDSTTYRAIEQDIRDDLRHLSDVHVTFMSDSQIDNLVVNLHHQNPRFILLSTLGGERDRNGRSVMLKDAIGAVVRSSNAVVLAMEDGYIQEGVLGGFVTNSHRQASVAATMMLRYLNGDPIASLPPVENSPDDYILDDREVAARNVNLPREVVMRALHVHVPVGYYEQYRQYIVGTIVILGFFVFVVTAIAYGSLRRKNRQLMAAAQLLAEKSAAVDKLNEDLSIKNRDLAVQANELGAMSEMANAANAAKSEFLASMSHEIRTPMNGIVGMTRLLLNSQLSPEQRRFAETVRVSADALLNIINDILDLSKLESGKLELEQISFEIRPLIEGVVDILSPRVKDRSIDLLYLVPNSATGVFRGDPGRLRQILLNLVGNAIKFTEKGSISVVVSMGQRDDGTPMMKVNVIDTGIGIPLSGHSRIFKSFSQVDSSVSRRFGGTGLGLSICKRIVEQMGGGIGFDSSPGEGSNFWFSVPLVLTDEAPEHESHGDIMANVRVLIVDEDRTCREFYSHLLQHWGAVVHTAGSGMLALNEIRTALDKGRPYDLIISAEDMAGMAGAELAGQVADLPGCSTLPVVLISGEGRVSVDSSQIPFRFIVPKPVHQGTLLDVLLMALGRTNPAGGNVAETDEGVLANLETLVAGQCRNARILLAEDNRINQEVVLAMLADVGIVPKIVETGEQAVQAMRTQAFDLILMDVLMPEMNGFDATGQIRSLDQGRNIPIIAMTANAFAEDRQKCIDAGMSDYLSKPVLPETLMTMLLKWLTKS